MTQRPVPYRILGWAAVIGTSAAAGTLVAAVMLAIDFVPTAPEMTNPKEGWIVLHGSASRMLGMACFAALLVLVWPTGRPQPWRRPLPVVAAIVATAVSAVAIMTLDRVLWDQAVLEWVPAEGGVGGNWWAAFAAEVESLVIDGSEVSQRSYAATLMVHLLSPALATVALLTAVLAARRVTASSPPRGSARSSQSGGSST